MRWSVLTFMIIGLWLASHAQFTLILTGTPSPITELTTDEDTLVIMGQFNYFAKLYGFDDTVVSFSAPGLAGYANSNFQIVGNRYYVLSTQGSPYKHNYILRSNDYGKNWSVLYDTSGQFYTLTVLDSTLGIMGGSYGNYAMTEGCDTAWKLRTPLVSDLLASAGYSDSVLLMMSTFSIAYLSEDRGNTWNWITGPSFGHKEIQFVNRDTIYSIAQRGTGNPTSFLYRSFDGGHSWNSVQLCWNQVLNKYDYCEIYDLYFNSTKHGYAIGYDYDLVESVILETNDYGQNWYLHPTGIQEEFYEMANVNDSIAYIGGSNGSLYRWNKTQKNCSVTLASTAASCPLCCDACITATPSGPCPPYTAYWEPYDPNNPFPCSACADTTFIITVTDGCGCTTKDTITPDTVPVGLHIPGFEDDHYFSIFPNPSRSELSITYDLPVHTKPIISFYSITGDIVKQIQLAGSRSSYTQSIEDIPAGIYIIVLSSNGNVYGQKKFAKLK